LDDHAWHRYRVGPRETGIIFAKTRPINRYEQGPHGTINRGIAPEWFSHDSGRRSRTPVKLDDIPSTGGTKPDSWRDQGRSLAVHRPHDVGTSRPDRADIRSHDLPTPRSSKTEARTETPRLYINNVAADTSVTQRPARNWSPNVGASRSENQTPTQAAQTEPLSRSFNNGPAQRDPDHSGRLIMEKLSPRPSAPEAAVSPSDNGQTPSPFVNSRSNYRALQPPRDTVSTGPAKRSQQPAPFHPTQPAGENPTPRFNFSSPSPAASGSLGRPASRSGSLQPVGPQPSAPSPSMASPQIGSRSFTPTPAPRMAPVQFPRPSNPPATVQPRFVPPSAPVLSRSSAPRFQAPATSPSTQPRFQTPSRSGPGQTKPGRDQ
jgi:hypothetical protein